jgi:putative transposase
MHEHSGGIIGAPRIHEDLVAEGESASLNRIARVMAADELQGWPGKEGKRQGRVNHRPDAINNLPEPDLRGQESETKWITDIAETGTLEGNHVLE